MADSNTAGSPVAHRLRSVVIISPATVSGVLAATGKFTALTTFQIISSILYLLAFLVGAAVGITQGIFNKTVKSPVPSPRSDRHSSPVGLLAHEELPLAPKHLFGSLEPYDGSIEEQRHTEAMDAGDLVGPGAIASASIGKPAAAEEDLEKRQSEYAAALAGFTGSERTITPGGDEKPFEPIPIYAPGLNLHPGRKITAEPYTFSSEPVSVEEEIPIDLHPRHPVVPHEEPDPIAASVAGAVAVPCDPHHERVVTVDRELRQAFILPPPVEEKEENEQKDAEEAPVGVEEQEQQRRRVSVTAYAAPVEEKEEDTEIEQEVKSPTPAAAFTAPEPEPREIPIEFKEEEPTAAAAAPKSPESEGIRRSDEPSHEERAAEVPVTRAAGMYIGPVMGGHVGEKASSVEKAEREIPIEGLEEEEKEVKQPVMSQVATPKAPPPESPFVAKSDTPTSFASTASPATTPTAAAAAEEGGKQKKKKGRGPIRGPLHKMAKEIRKVMHTSKVP